MQEARGQVCTVHIPGARAAGHVALADEFAKHDIAAARTVLRHVATSCQASTANGFAFDVVDAGSMFSGVVAETADRPVTTGFASEDTGCHVRSVGRHSDLRISPLRRGRRRDTGLKNRDAIGDLGPRIIVEHAVIIDIEWNDPPSVSDEADIELHAPPTTRVTLESCGQFPKDVRVEKIAYNALYPIRELRRSTFFSARGRTWDVNGMPECVLSSVKVRTEQVTMGTLICSALRDSLEGAEVCLFVSGGIRGAREYPDEFSYVT